MNFYNCLIKFFPSLSIFALIYFTSTIYLFLVYEREIGYCNSKP